MTDQNGFDDFLGDRDRILVAGWCLPNDGPLTEAQRTQAMANFHAYIRRRGLSVRQVANQVGTPRETTINELIKGQFRAGADDHVRTLNNWVEQHSRAAVVQVGEAFVPTRVANEILNAARLVRENKTMGLVVGPAGIGKTRCAKALHETFAGAILMTCRVGLCTATGIRNGLADVLKLRSESQARYGYVGNILDKILEKLRDSGRLIIIDEAHKLTADGLEFVRELHDSTGCPVFMLATKDLADRLRKGTDPDHGQLFSRVDIIRPLTAGHDQGRTDRPLFTIEEIRQLYQQPPIRLSPDAARYLQDVANTLGMGSLRRCRILMLNAVRRARKRMNVGDSEPVTVTADDLAYTDERLRLEAADLEEVRQRRERVIAAAG